MSDISTFAEWEAQERDQLEEGEEVLSERQQKLLDMASEGRVWADMDSSNDLRSFASDEEDMEGGGVELSANAETAPRMTVNEKLMGGVRINSTLGNGAEIPSSTLDPAQVLLQTLDDAEYPPSSQPRRPSSNVESIQLEESQTNGHNYKGEAEEDESENPFDGFEVEESEKEFLLSLLDAAPAEEVEALKAISSAKSTTMEEFCVTPAPRSTVEKFAHTHPLWCSGILLGSGKGSDLVDTNMSQFKRDVYEYARAAGMGKNQAKVEVMRAVAAWRKENGVGCGEVLDEGESETDKEFYAISLAPSAKATVPLVNSGAMGTKKASKGKQNDLLDTVTPKVVLSQAVEVDMDEKKRLRKELKMARRRAFRELKKEQSGQNSVARADQNMDDQDAPAALEPMPTDLSVNEPARKKKKSKPGPTTSSYFVKPAVPSHDAEQEHTVNVDIVTKASTSSKRARKRQRVEARLESGSTFTGAVSAALKPEKLVPEAVVMEEEVVTTEPSVNQQASLLPEVELVSSVVHYDQNSGERVVGGQEKKHKRKKRKRNHNLLPDEKVVAEGDHTTKRSHPEAPIQDVPATHEEAEPQDVSDIRENDGEDIDMSKAKKNRRRKRRSDDEPTMLDELPQPLPNPQDAEIPMDNPVVEAINGQANSEVLIAKEEIKEASNKRGRKAKGKKEEREPVTQESLECQLLNLPLSELANTNTKQGMQGTEDRGRGRRRESDEPFQMEVDIQLSNQDSASGSQLLDVQLRVLLSEETNIIPQPDDSHGYETIDNPGEQPTTPRRDFDIVIYSPSKARMPKEQKSKSRYHSATAVKQDDDDTSIFSMVDYGSLDWDHSGDESDFYRSKPKRRASSVYPTRRRSLLDAEYALVPKRRPRARSCPSPAARREPQSRDVKGRFARKGSTGSDAFVTSKKEKKVPLRRPSSSSGEKSMQQRDANGRFAKRPSIADQTLVPVVEIPAIYDPEADSVPRQKSKPKRLPAKSPYFPALVSPPYTPKKGPNADSKEKSPSKRPPGGTVSCIPFPPLSAPYFGLIQEKLAHDPFRLLIAVTFLIKTNGKHAIPAFYELMSKYPTSESLAAAEKEDIISIIRHLGLQNSRAATYQTYAKIWLENPPAKGRRYPVRGYPRKDSGRDIAKDEVFIDDEDPREAWELGHMTSGPYALDSWRIFCRDILRGVASGWNGEDAHEDGFQPEWMRVLPEDKELRAYLRWMWLKEGFEWDPLTGEKEVASVQLTRAAMEGRIAWDDRGVMRIIDPGDEEEQVADGLVQGGLGMKHLLEIPDTDADADADDDLMMMAEGE